MSRKDVLKNFEKYAQETEERVEYGIEHYRKGTFKLPIVDEQGKPIVGKKVKLTQKKHEFKFGANIFMLDELETPEKNELYKKYFVEIFNMATLPFYWDATEPEKGKQRYGKDSPKLYRRPPIDSCIEFCKENGIEPREHALAYDHFFPDWVKDLPLFEEKKEVARRFKEISERYSDVIPTIEVTNECFWNNDAASELYNEDDFVEWCFEQADRYFPNNQLVINEWTGAIWDQAFRNRSAYYMQIERALHRGVRIDAIGMQYHMFYAKEDELRSTAWSYMPRHLFGVMDRFADFNLPLQITEVTIPAYSYEEEDEEIQAEILRNLYRIWFSHKNVEQIIYWNLVDGYAAFAPQGDFSSGENYYRGGLLRFDMTPKPAYYVLKNLIEKEWHTETEVVTDDRGIAYFKGFYGEYEAEIDGEKYFVKASKKMRTDDEYDKKLSKIIVK